MASNKRKKQSKRWLCWSSVVFLLLVALLQSIMVYQSSTILFTQDTPALSTTSTFQTKRIPKTARREAKTTRSFRKPRILVGIIGNSNNHMGKVYRWRHRVLFDLWNDTRICTLHDFQQDLMARTADRPPLRPWDSYADYLDDSIDCQIVYTFVVGGHNDTSGKPTYLLDDSRPMTLKSIPLQPRFKDINNTDVTLLNIAENMNDGKTPTFFFWASQVAKKYGLDYVMKCDSDALLRLNALLQFLYRELPWTPITKTPGVRPQPPLTLLGSFRHKAFWNHTADEGFWNQEYFNGMHLYIAGQLYLMSVDLIDYMVQEARQVHQPNSAVSYQEGHEDHDATSMMQKATFHTPVRWISMPRHYKFWEHPVKGEFWWKKILKREKKKEAEGKRSPRFDYSKPESLVPPKRSLVIILGATTPQAQEEYQIRWKAANPERTICPVSWNANAHDSAQCDVYYAFVVGQNPNGPTEQVHNIDTLLSDESLSSSSQSGVWSLNLKDNIHSGIGTSTLFLIDQRVEDYRKRFDCIIFLQSSVLLHIDKWLQIMALQSSPHSLLIGDVRDKDQPPVEDFIRQKQRINELGDPVRNETHWYFEYENIHLYLGSECFAIGTSLVSGIVEQAQLPAHNSTARGYLLGNLGHDISTWAYFVPKTVLHWVPINRSIRFWMS